MTKPKPMPPLEELRRVFSYDSRTGVLYRINKDKSLTPCTNLCGQGYYRTKYKGEAYKVSRLIWYLVTGEDPMELTIDHINRIRHDNRLSNLRLADHSLQKQNRGVLSTSSTKLKGAYKNNKKYGKPYRSAIMKNGVRISLGTFDSAYEAHKAYVKAGGIP